MSRKARILALGAVAVLVTAAGAAYAAIPGSNGTIQGCYGKVTGNLRVIDVPKGEKCSKLLEEPLAWSQQGPKGDKGDPGLKGDKGDKGDPGQATLQSLQDTQDGYPLDGVGIPDDDAYHSFASVSPSAGTHLVIANGAIYSEGNVDEFAGVNCSIRDGSTTLHTVRLIDDNLDDEGMFPFSLSAVASVSSGTLELACFANDGADGLFLYSGRIVAVKVG